MGLLQKRTNDGIEGKENGDVHWRKKDLGDCRQSKLGEDRVEFALGLRNIQLQNGVEQGKESC